MRRNNHKSWNLNSQRKINSLLKTNNNKERSFTIDSSLNGTKNDESFNHLSNYLERQVEYFSSNLLTWCLYGTCKMSYTICVGNIYSFSFLVMNL